MWAGHSWLPSQGKWADCDEVTRTLGRAEHIALGVRVASGQEVQIPLIRAGLFPKSWTVAACAGFRRVGTLLGGLCFRHDWVWAMGKWRGLSVRLHPAL